MCEHFSGEGEVDTANTGATGHDRPVEWALGTSPTQLVHYFLFLRMQIGHIETGAFGLIDWFWC